MGKSLNIFMVAVLASLITVSAPVEDALAQSAVKLIKQRQGVMKENNIHVKAIRKFVKGPKKGLTGKKLKKAVSRLGTAADMELRAIAIAGQFDRLLAKFPKGTSSADGVVKTRAKPVIWARWDDFKAAAANAKSLAQGLEKAAAKGDTAEIKAAVGTMYNKGCNGCHRTFRAPKKRKKKSS
jgi:cytochrome c556